MKKFLVFLIILYTPAFYGMRQSLTHFYTRANKPQKINVIQLAQDDENNDQIAQLLRQNQADITVQEESGKTCLHAAATHNAHKNLATILAHYKTTMQPQQFKVFIQERDNSNRSALHDALVMHTVPCVEILLQYGSNPHESLFGPKGVDCLVHDGTMWEGEKYQRKKAALFLLDKHNVAISLTKDANVCTTNNIHGVPPFSEEVQKNKANFRACILALSHMPWLREARTGRTSLFSLLPADVYMLIKEFMVEKSLTQK